MSVCVYRADTKFYIEKVHLIADLTIKNQAAIEIYF